MTKYWQLLLVGVSVTSAGILFSCGSGNDDDKDSGSGTQFTWEKDIASMVATDCSAAGCHGTAIPGSTVFQDNEANFLAAKTLVINRLSKKPGTGGYMPQGISNYDSAKMQKMIDFLSQ